MAARLGNAGLRNDWGRSLGGQLLQWGAQHDQSRVDGREVVEELDDHLKAGLDADPAHEEGQLARQHERRRAARRHGAHDDANAEAVDHESEHGDDDHNGSTMLIDAMIMIMVVDTGY